jgi:hypothetical protein
VILGGTQGRVGDFPVQVFRCWLDIAPTEYDNGKVAACIFGSSQMFGVSLSYMEPQNRFAQQWLCAGTVTAY